MVLVLDREEAQQAMAKPSPDFHHPYTPYAIQETFMSTVYQVLEEGKVGILESPTGTVSIASRLSTCPTSRDLDCPLFLKEGREVTVPEQDIFYPPQKLMWPCRASH